MKNVIKKGCLFILGATAVCLLHACALGKHYKQPELNLPQVIVPDATDSMTVADLQWWEVYTDTTLQSLIHKALTYNKDILAATERIREMKYLKRINTANLLPQVTADVSAEREFENYGGKNEDASNTFEAKLLLNWEIDLWGNLRWAQQKGRAEYMQSVEAYRAMQMTLIAEVAQDYFELMALDNELAIVRQTLATREEGARQAKLRFEGGLTSETSFQQAQVELARTATLIPELELKITQMENELAVLTGEYPGYVRRGVMPDQIAAPKDLPIGLPSTLLQRRPDLRLAEQKLIVANAQTGMAFTDMFPRISFSGTYGLESDAFSNFFRSPYGFLGGQLLSPIFSAGKKRAMWRAKQAAYEQERYQYEKSVLTAFKEVNNAIVDFNKAKEAYVLKRDLERASKKYVELAHLQYFNGVIGYLDVMDAQRGYFDAQKGLSNALRDQQMALVRLYKALGGGWDPEEVKK